MVLAYRFVTRPSDVAHGHPFLVYDTAGQLHFVLTRFAFEATNYVSIETTQVYLYALLPYFTWLDTEPFLKKNKYCWNEVPVKVRDIVEDYLIQQMGCQLRQHYLGFKLVRPTVKTPTKVRIFLVALKFFYKVLIKREEYKYENPLIDLQTVILATVEQYFQQSDELPRMPDISGVEKPDNRQRLTDSYYKFSGEDWIPQIIDDPNLPRLILEGGRQLKGWGLREECVTRMLFDTGGRISEIVGLTLADWVERGMKQEVNAFNKGSAGRRIKFLRFSSDTAKLLRRYFNQERVQNDSHQYTLNDYIQKIQKESIDLKVVPLFLTKRKTILSAKTYRDNYWNKACQIAGLKADVHQARHWYVTMAIRQIYELSSTESEVQKRLRELQEYMKWRSRETIKAYEHYFDASRHAEVQNRIHQQMENALNKLLAERQKQHQPTDFSIYKTVESITEQEVIDAEFDYLQQIGGKGSARANS